MTNEEISQFINQQKSVGANKDQVANFLRLVGFSDQQVDKAWKSTEEIPSSANNESVAGEPPTIEKTLNSTPLTAGWTPENPGRNNKKIIWGIILILALALIGTGGVFAYLQYFPSSPITTKSGNEILKQVLENIDKIESLAAINQSNIRISIDAPSTSGSTKKMEIDFNLNQNIKSQLKDLVFQQNMKIDVTVNTNDTIFKGVANVDQVNDKHIFYLKLNDLQIPTMISSMLPPIDNLIGQWIKIENNKYGTITNYKDIRSEMYKSLTTNTNLTENDLDKILASVIKNFWESEVLNVVNKGQEIIGNDKTYHLSITPNIQNLKPFILKIVEDNIDIIVKLDDGYSDIKEADDILKRFEEEIDKTIKKLMVKWKTDNTVENLKVELWVGQKDFWPRRFIVNGNFTTEIIEQESTNKMTLYFELNSLVKDINQPQNISIPQTYKNLEEILENFVFLSPLTSIPNVPIGDSQQQDIEITDFQDFEF